MVKVQHHLHSNLTILNSPNRPPQFSLYSQSKTRFPRSAAKSKSTAYRSVWKSTLDLIILFSVRTCGIEWDDLFFVKDLLSPIFLAILFQFSVSPTSRYGSVINSNYFASCFSIDQTASRFSDESGLHHSVSSQCRMTMFKCSNVQFVSQVLQPRLKPRHIDSTQKPRLIGLFSNFEQYLTHRQERHLQIFSSVEQFESLCIYFDHK